MTQFWLRTDVGPHFMDCLGLFEEQIGLVTQDIRRWQWVIVAGVMTVQAASVLFINERDSTSLAALTKSSALAWLNAYEAKDFSSYKGGYLKPPKDLVRQVRRAEPRNFSGIDFDNINKLIELRRKIMHFTPEAWSLEVSGMPRICRTTAEYVSTILDKKGMYAASRLDENNRALAKRTCSRILSHVETSED